MKLNIALTWSEGTELVLDSYESFSPELAAAARRFIDDRWIDALRGLATK